MNIKSLKVGDEVVLRYIGGPKGRATVIEEYPQFYVLKHNSAGFCFCVHKADLVNEPKYTDLKEIKLVSQ